MLKNQENNVGGKSSPVWSFIKKNATTIIMVFIVGLIFFNPNAKSFFIRQLMHTGLFNARIDSKNTTALSKESSYFQYEDERGNIYNTESLRGKVVFINFWASWCGPCIAEFPSIETLYTEYKDHLGIEFLLLNEDNEPAVGKAFLEDESFTVPFYRTIGAVPSNFYSGRLPTTIVLDKNGVVRFRHTGFANYDSKKFKKQLEAIMNE